MSRLERWLFGHLLDSRPADQELSKRAYRRARQFAEHFAATSSRPDKTDSINAQEWAAIVASEERNNRLGSEQ